MPALPITWDANLPYIQVLTASSGGGGAAVKVAILSEHQPSGTQGGTSTAGSWFTRTLNTKDYDPDGIVALAANQFTLQAGTYLIIGRAPAAYCNVMKCKIVNVTAGTDVQIGGNSYNNQTYPQMLQSFVFAAVKPVAATVYALQQRVGNGVATNGLGVASSFGVDEIYSSVVIIQVA